MVSGTWFEFGRDVVQVLHVSGELGVFAVAELFPVHLPRSRAQEDVVVDVGDVPDVGDVAAEEAEVADEGVERGVGERVAEVGRVVGSDAADVDADALVRRGAPSGGRGCCRAGCQAWTNSGVRAETSSPMFSISSKAATVSIAPSIADPGRTAAAQSRNLSQSCIPGERVLRIAFGRLDDAGVVDLAGCIHSSLRPAADREGRGASLLSYDDSLHELA